MNTPIPHQRIGVALSGGLDSTLTAYLLKAAGHQVEAWHMLLPKFCGDCQLHTEQTGEADAAAMADWLEIPFHTIDCTEAFDREVITPFARDYSQGLTPNPCTFCNPRIKFGILRDAIIASGCQAIATGHYARITTCPDSSEQSIRCAKDPLKDQSYFLYALTQPQIQSVYFPLGDFLYEQVRTRAAEVGIPIKEKKSSQDICFLPQGDYRPLVQSRHPESMIPGDILDPTGKKIGTHQGLANYTLGQRRGLGVATGGRAFVTSFDREANTLTLGSKEALSTTQFKVHHLNWQVQPTGQTIDCVAVPRYHAKPFPCTVTLIDRGQASVSTNHAQWLISPGQACVFYRRDAVIGGGLIAP